MARRILWDAGILIAAIIVAVAIRLFLVALYTIPTESMLPRFRVGDYLVVAKWPYGWSGDGGPLARHLWDGRIAARMPRRGDVVVFKAPPALKVDYVKRVIGLPGDVVALRYGSVIVNGRALPRRRIADLIVPVAPNSPCRPEPGADVRPTLADGSPACRYPRYRETMPEGPAYTVLDLGTSDADTFGPVTVPAGRLFLLGDNRDRSADSRFPAEDGGAVGMVPLDTLVGRPILILFSTDGSAHPGDPISWWRALRRGRFLRPL